MAKQELTALQSLLEQADLILSTTSPLPENRTAALRELLQAALAITGDLVTQSATHAAVMGRKGGSTTSRRHGPEHYRKMAARRKTHGGGRPPKESA